MSNISNSKHLCRGMMIVLSLLVMSLVFACAITTESIHAQSSKWKLLNNYDKPVKIGKYYFKLRYKTRNTGYDINIWQYSKNKKTGYRDLYKYSSLSKHRDWFLEDGGSLITNGKSFYIYPNYSDRKSLNSYVIVFSSKIGSKKLKERSIIKTGKVEKERNYESENESYDYSSPIYSVGMIYGNSVLFHTIEDCFIYNRKNGKVSDRIKNKEFDSGEGKYVLLDDLVEPGLGVMYRITLYNIKSGKFKKVRVITKSGQATFHKSTLFLLEQKGKKARLYLCKRNSKKKRLLHTYKVKDYTTLVKVTSKFVRLEVDDHSYRYYYKSGKIKKDKKLISW